MASKKECIWINKSKVKTYLLNNGIKNFTTQEVPGNRQFTVNEADRRVVWVLDIEARKVEHLVCGMCVSACARVAVDLEGDAPSSASPWYTILVVSEKLCIKYASDAAADIGDQDRHHTYARLNDASRGGKQRQRAKARAPSRWAG